MFKLENIIHAYDDVPVLELPHFAGKQGEHWLVMGQSGSGKTTLLHLMAGLLRPSSGSVRVAGEEINKLRGARLDTFRGRNIGIVFQQMHLLTTLTVAGNLLLAQYLAGLRQEPARVQEVLSSLDIAKKVNAYPEALSHGEQQRVAIARAVINRPLAILADEPTSSLDDMHSGQVLDLLIDQADRQNATLILTTHDRRAQERFENKLTLKMHLQNEVIKP